jgi:DNA (cytosine-5)-methyltransferase 1
MSERWPFYEFFAGGGLARAGLGARWSCVFANEISEKKAHAYRLNFGPSPELLVEDIRGLKIDDLPAGAMLAWASFPCQDLSLAGKGTGLAGERSGTFWAFWGLMAGLSRRGSKVPLVVIENVAGLISANGGGDFRSLVEAVADAGYRTGCLVVDAAHFVPQSRPRLFIVAVAADQSIPEDLVSDRPMEPWHNQRVCRAVEAFPDALRDRWIWWKLPRPKVRRVDLTALIMDQPENAQWHTRQETDRLLGMMSEVNLEKVRNAQAVGARVAGTIYKRIRIDPQGNRAQRAEVRFDQISGCLRTPAGGSSRQFVILVEGPSVRTRLLAPREAARLMGVPDAYVLPSKYNEAYHVMGDGLAVPVVQWLEAKLLRRVAAQVCVRNAQMA